MSVIPVTMRRVRVAAVDRVEVVEVPVPRPGPGEVLVAMLASGVCGSDVHAAHGRHPFVPLPYLPGHEVVGTVVEVGEGAAEVATGQRVTVEPTLVCGHCKQCAQGRENLCENLRFFGCGYEQGGMADYFTIPASRLHAVPDGFTPAQAALIEPLATPVHAVRLAGDLSGKAVAILGAGTIGLLTLVAARAAGAQRIVMTDLLPGKRDRAIRLGADAAVHGAEPDVAGAVRAQLGESADVVFDCVAVQASVDQAIAMALKAGTVVIVGVPARDVTIPLPVVQDQQIRIQGSATYLPEDFRDAIGLLRQGRVAADELVTATFPLDQAQDAFAAAASGDQIKVLVTL